MEKVLNILNMRIGYFNKHKDLTAHYKTLKTDQERIEFTLNTMITYDILPEAHDIFPKVHDKPVEKSAAEADRLRQLGNKTFVTGPITEKTCFEALKLYTQSAAYAPYPSKQLALAYANRSAVLVKFQKYIECIQDIDRALKLDYPDDLKAKLYVRKAECLQALGTPLTDEVYNKTLEWLDKMLLNDNQEKLKDKLNSIRNSKIKKQSKKQQNFLTFTLNTKNPEVPYASDAVAIKYNEEYGRHIIATRDISPGEVIAIEKPYSLFLTFENIYTHCANCLNVSWANIPCDFCTCTMYCSEECKAIHWKKYHDIECFVFPRLVEMNFYPMDFFSIKLAIQALREAKSFENLKKELKIVDQSTDPRTKGFSDDGIFHSDRYRSIYSLATNTEKRIVPDLFRRSLDSCFMLYYLATRTSLFGKKISNDLTSLVENDDVTFFGSLILRHQQIIPTNCHTFSEERDIDYVERGIAAMPFASLINHSCDPNIFRHSLSDRIVLLAIYPIKKDTQIFDNYGKHYAITPKLTRQEKLMKQYYFCCKCRVCQEDWPLYMNLKSIHTLEKSTEKKSKILPMLEKLEIYIDLVKERNFAETEIIIDLLKIIKILYECAPLPCAELNNAVETLKRVYDLNGNRFVIPNI